MPGPLSWVAADFLTGELIVDLPNIEIYEDLAVTIGQAEQATVNLHLDEDTPASWVDGTTPGKAVLLAYIGDLDNIVFGGIVEQRDRDNTTVVELTLTSAETYLDSCYVGDYTATNINQDTILSSLIAYAAGTNRPTWDLNHVTPSTAKQSVAYTADSNTTVLAALQALSAVQGGPEWLITWHVVAGAATTRVRPLITYGSRIGTPAGADGPTVVVELADLQAGSGLHEDYSNGQGANKVTAYGTAPTNAADDSVPSASATALDLQGRPLWEYRYQPNATVSSTSVLATYAQQALLVMQNGTQPLTLVLANDLPGKTLGVDWNLGDDIGWYLSGIAFPTAATGTARCVGYKIDHATVTPILQGPAT
jgi:hypothetical protein